MMIPGYTLIPVNDESGVISIIQRDELGEILYEQEVISYSNYSAESCTFDLTNMVGLSGLEAELVTDNYYVNVQ